jgi:flavin-dependent dehydrogenase
MLLARRGARVLVVDRATFPSDIPHGHFIHRHGPRRLKEWGLLDRVAAVAPPITKMITDFGDFPLLSEGLEVDGVAWGYGPRRSTLDAILVDAAVEAGAELRQGFNVDEFLFEGDRVVGIKGRDADGATVEEQATITVGADGRNSRLARVVKAPVYNEQPVLLAWYFSYWSGVQSEPFEMYVRTEQRRVILSFRTDNNDFAIFMGVPIEEMAAFREDIETSFLASLDYAPEFAARVRAGKQIDRFYGASDLPNFYRKPYGPGWALVGDAGAHKDPYMALGICDALRDVEFLADAIDEGLAGKTTMDEALGGYERRRNEASARDYDENLVAARFTPQPPPVLALRAAVRNNPEGARDLMLARFGLIDQAAFFAPENIQRLMAAGAVSGPA